MIVEEKEVGLQGIIEEVSGRRDDDKVVRGGLKDLHFIHFLVQHAKLIKVHKPFILPRREMVRVTVREIPVNLFYGICLFICLLLKEGRRREVGETQTTK